MQDNNDKTKYFKQILGETLKELRIENRGESRNKFANEYGLNDSNLGKIEDGLIDCKFITLWKTVESMGIDFVKFASVLSKKLGKDFTLIDE